MKQTAVEWLIDHLTEIHPEAFDQAKEMEKEQMERIYYGYNQYNDEHLDFEQYYNETFKSE